MRRLTSAAVLFAVSATAQHLTVAPSTIPGLEFVTPQSPEFAGRVTQILGTQRPIALAAALPYSIVIRNITSQSIAAIDTVWTATDRLLLNAADSMFKNPILYVKPGQSIVVTPAGILQNERQLAIFASGTTEGHRLENFQNPGDVTVAVDAVVFESGQFVGANRYGAFEQWKAEIQAPRDLAAAVLQRQPTQPITDIVSWLEGLATTRRPPAAPGAREAVLTARVLVAVYRRDGEAAMYSRARSILDAPTFPLSR